MMATEQCITGFGTRRNAMIINRKFFRYLVPAVMSTIAISLNEFVDSIIVSQLLGVQAMTMVNMGCPLMLAFAVIYAFFGVGGTVLYGKHAGGQNLDQAGRTFTVTLLASVVLAAVLTVAGLLLFGPLSGVLCADADLQGVFRPYLKTLLISAMLIIPLQVIIYFLSALGRPGLGMAVNITANAVNLLMDYVYIRFFNTGLKGAAMATFTGYAFGFLMVLSAIALKKLRLPFKRIRRSDLTEIPAILSRGVAPAIIQFGYCIKISFCNNLAMSVAGISGVTVFSLCMQAVSIASIVIAGIVEAMTPIASSLQGQRDFNGMRMLLKTVFKVQFLANAVLVALMEIYPHPILLLYNVPDIYSRASITALRIFSLMFILRGFVLVFMYYYQISNRKVYAMLISVADGFAGIIPLALLFTGLFGIIGIWIAFPVLSALMLIAILAVNTFISRRRNNRFHGLLLLEEEDGKVPVYDVSIRLDNEAIAQNSLMLQRFCERELGDKTMSALVAVAAEEMGVYSMSMREQTSLDELDILVKIYPKEILMDFRSIGKPFNIATASQKGFSNAFMLKKIASREEYGYIIGMNQTRIHIKRDRSVEK